MAENAEAKIDESQEAESNTKTEEEILEQNEIEEQEIPAQQAAEEVVEEEIDPSEEIADLKDKNLRLLAEMQNLRVRQQKDLKEAREFAITGFANDMLSVLENLNRASENIPESDDEVFKSLATGLDMTRDEVNRILGKYDIKRVEPKKGDDFDYKIHQALVQIPTNEFPEGKIVQVIQAGFTMKERVLRPAMVGVAKALPEVNPADAEEEASESEEK